MIKQFIWSFIWVCLEAAFQRLQAACLCWSGVEDSPSNSKSKSSVLGSELAAQSCESLVRALRLLNDSVACSQLL